MSKKNLKVEIQDLKVTIRIGHNSTVDKIVSEIKDQMNNKKLVKLKANKGVLDSESRKSYWFELAKLSNSEVVTQIGNIAILIKK
ncbi:MAG: hypothetical protein CMB56_000810 [Methanobacteriota archaeon]|nr:MAG: hypothetical protein CMB56_000810 [Euryarchaeota archaeon]|tara:strand:+ start:95 stop:349 length:255 start_codon:yes stop_codon:yes gene_type:complete